MKLHKEQLLKKNQRMGQQSSLTQKEAPSDKLSDDVFDSHNKEIERTDNQSSSVIERRHRLTSNGENSKYLDDWVDDGHPPKNKEQAEISDSEAYDHSDEDR